MPPILVEPDEEEGGEEGKRRRREARSKRYIGRNDVDLKESRMKEARMEKLEIYKKFENTLDM